MTCGAVVRSRSLMPLIAVLLCAGCGVPAPAAPSKMDAFLYEDTRRLVAFVEGAADLVQRRGRTAAFAEFDRPDSPWRDPATYLFIYDPSGTCLWHGLDPGLVGRNLITFRDALGKPVIEMITAVARHPAKDASDWIFYLWEERTQFLPTWKSSYVRKVVADDGSVYLVGAGSSLLKVEKVFVQEQVDAAARLVSQRGTEAAFRQLREPGSRFHFLETFVFVLDGKGRSVVDPAFPTIQGRDMSDFRDAVGRPIVKDVMRKLETADTAWVLFLWPKSGRMLPSRKLMYVRKVEAGGETLPHRLGLLPGHAGLDARLSGRDEPPATRSPLRRERPPARRGARRARRAAHLPDVQHARAARRARERDRRLLRRGARRGRPSR